MLLKMAATNNLSPCVMPLLTVVLVQLLNRQNNYP